MSYPPLRSSSPPRSRFARANRSEHGGALGERVVGGDAFRDHVAIAPPTAFENPRAFCAKAATALGGERGTGDGVASWLSSRFDPFLNQAFVAPAARPEVAADRLAGRPGFIWMASQPAPHAQRRLEGEGFALTAFFAMQTQSDDAGAFEPRDAALAAVDSPSALASWHAVYSEVLGADPRSLEDWRRLYDVLGPDGDASLLLWLATADDEPAATAAMFIDDHTAGLYCFATRERFRRRGLASELVSVCRHHAREGGVTRCVLQASAAGRPVYAQTGFVDIGRLPIFTRR